MQMYVYTFANYGDKYNTHTQIKESVEMSQANSSILTLELP